MGCHNSKVDDKKEIDLSIKKDRHCTDILCLLIFIIFFIVFIGVGVFGLIKGDGYRLIYATDYQGHTCGTGALGTYTYYPRLNQDFALALKNTKATSVSSLDMSSISLYGVCVSKCPKAGDIVCNYAVTTPPTDDVYAAKCGTTALQLVNSDVCNNCWSSPLDSASVLYRCVWQEADNVVQTQRCTQPDSPADPTASGYVDPTSTSCISKTVITLTTAKKAAQDNPAVSSVASFSKIMSGIVGDIVLARIPVVICGFVFALILGFVWLIFLQLFGSCLVAFTLWGSVIGCFVLTAFCFAKAGILTASNVASVVNTLQAKANVTVVNTAAALSAAANSTAFTTITTATSADGNQSKWEIAAFVLLALSVILLIFTVAMNKKIKVAVGVLKEASAAIQDVPIVVITPLFTLSLTIILFAWFVVTEASLKSMGTITLGSVQATAGTNITVPAAFASDPLGDYLLWFNLFGFLWVLNFIQGVGMMTVAGVVGEWYYTRPPADGSKKDLPNSKCCESLSRVFRYHLGSVAFGSFIIAVVQFVRAILAYIDEHTKNLQQSNCVLKIIMKVVQCCLWCFEKCIKFISFNAYVIIALRGDGFVSSTCTAVKLILGEVLTIGVLSVVSAFMMLLGKLFITAVCMILVYLWLQYIPPLYDLTNTLSPVIFVGVLAYSIARNFLSIYGMAIDTIMLCYCEDMAANKNDKSRAYAGKPLRKALGIAGDPMKAEGVTSVPVTPKKGGEVEEKKVGGGEGEKKGDDGDML